MENNRNMPFPLQTLLRVKNRMTEIIASDKYKCGITACLCTGILFGCMTQAVYGHGGDWSGVTEQYCAGFPEPLLAVTPVTLGFVALIFAAAPFRIARMLIYPGAAVRGMGFGALLCGALQCGSLREMCFAALVLLPYAAVNCTIAVYAGEYALGCCESFTGQNKGLTGTLLLHSFKMAAVYLALSGLSCAFFAASCCLFGVYLI